MNLKKILIPIPSTDFDPTETAVPWKILQENNVSIVFATPDGKEAKCDLRMLVGRGLGILSPLLAADKNGRAAYYKMANSHEFKNPIAWKEIKACEYDGIILPGGHAKGMREYLESQLLVDILHLFFSSKKPIGAICHGVVLAARSKALFGKKTTALLATQELAAWALTCLWLGDYYRTYKQTVEAEVKSLLATEKDFIHGPLPLFRDSPNNLHNGFVVRDGNYLSARWPGDAHLFGKTFFKMLQEHV